MKRYTLDQVANFSVVVAELSHIFCCGLPILVAVLASTVQLGVGGGILMYHDALHQYEVPILIASGLLLIVGLLLQYVSFKINCRTTGCHHGDCAPKKMQVSKLFIFAVSMYAANLAIYYFSGHGVALH